MKQAEIYGQRVSAADEGALLDAIGTALAGRPWDLQLCRMLDVPESAPEQATSEAAPVFQDSPQGWGVTVDGVAPRILDAEAIEAAQIAQRGDGRQSVGVSELGAARATADAVKLTQLGFVVPPPLYAVGSLVNSTGVENATRKRLEHDAKPLLGEAVAAFERLIATEKRHDILIDNVSSLRFDDDGSVFLLNGTQINFGVASFDMFCRRLDMPRGAGTYLAGIDPDMRAWNLRKWVERNPAKPFKLRIRREREVFAVVSEKYVDYGADCVAHDLARALEDLPDLRATVDYDGARVQIDATAFSDVKPERYVAGEVFQVGARAGTVDDGTGSAKGGGSAVRNLCLNLYILAEMSAGGFSVAHRGSRAAFRQALRAGFDKASEAARTFVEQWNGDRQVADIRATVKPADGISFVPTGADAYSLNQLLWGVFVAEQARGALAVGQKELAGVMRAWQVEPESNRRGIANALTRYAHEGQADPWHANDIEQSAVSMLMSKRPLEWADPGVLQMRLQKRLS